MDQPRVLVVGYNAWDVTVPVAQLPPPDTKMDVERILMGGGGPAATAAVALRRLGAAVRLVTPLTDDEPGRWQANQLRQEGVDLQACPPRPGCASPMAVILVDVARQERTILAARGQVPHLEPAEVPASLLDGMDLLYCDGHEIPACLPLAEAARARGLPVVLDAGSVRPGAAALVALCTDVVSSRTFAPDLTGRADPAAALQGLRDLGPLRVAMTCGRGGVLALTDAGPTVVPAFAVDVVDTTGAGDAFHAGYAFGLALGEAFLPALDLGNATAALKCTGWGGRRTLPTLAAVRRLQASGRRSPPGPDLAGLPVWDGD